MSTTNKRAQRPEQAAAGTSGTVARVARLLAAIADADGPVGVGDLAERLGLAPSTVHRLLQLLRAEGLVSAESGDHRYAAGAEFYRISARVVASADVTSMARPYIEALARRFDETVLFGLYLPTRHAMAFTARADGTQALQYRIQMNTPGSLIWGASGRAILAHLPESRIEEVIGAAEPAPATGALPPGRAELEAELARIRETGFALTEGEKLPEARGIAAPVFGPSGVLGCLLLTSPKNRLPHGDVHVIGSTIADAAAEFSHAVGGPDRKATE
ncbi:IclR family transcriptional regulator [Streptomyces sp. SRF1]|uniref:IclR family transcriptional regulator n=1 Tax=Streptomyces sp. SRF1 TaxID=1549642 RepID=UPI0025AFE308|nr:IclR family transcriptional regulator [Streptomyces sp. SRF1]MDN3056430.1 IclR family transcriptional regulator [Streptomyces sp. SRF1]